MFLVPLLVWLQVGLARTIYIRCIYGVYGSEIIKYTVIYGADIRFWPTLLKPQVVQQERQPIPVTPWSRKRFVVSHLKLPYFKPQVVQQK